MDPTVALPIIGNSHDAYESESSVDDQKFSLRPEVNAREMNEAENLHCDTRAFHQLDGASMHRVTSERILKKMYFDTDTRTSCSRLSESVRDFACSKEKIFKRDATLRRTDAVQHCREDLVAVLQRSNFV